MHVIEVKIKNTAPLFRSSSTNHRQALVEILLFRLGILFRSCQNRALGSGLYNVALISSTAYCASRIRNADKPTPPTGSSPTILFHAWLCIFVVKLTIGEASKALGLVYYWYHFENGCSQDKDCNYAVWDLFS